MDGSGKDGLDSFGAPSFARAERRPFDVDDQGSESAASGAVAGVEVAIDAAGELRSTERLAPLSKGLDTCGGEEALARLFAGQLQAARAVEAAIPRIDDAVDLAVASLSGGGRLVYLAAGSPALIALADALEIPQTFSEDPGRFITILAGGAEITTRFGGVAEDDAAAARDAVAEAGIGPRDCVVAISASGSTPFVVEGLAAARHAGAASVAIANHAEAPILRAADVAVLLDTGPEIVAGSTRMGAGTAQKIALNMLSTGIAIRRGHVHDGHMVSLRADNAKLRDRAVRMIGDCAGVSPGRAAEALAESGGAVKPAILLAAGTADLSDAEARLARASGHLRDALGALEP
ncbi:MULTISPECIES: N-acetylmuramic acid 6-phosphate etherase [unclassified Aureimonas]|uniref:N-acetylmuramic acid 6-phosphate etherase n=1 Tax=unclassified Aureimonas TaxID=2615206 RepID=UPI001FCCDD54|nr:MULTISPECIES: N-acetylmuramic acid 6-phosphate etherase [unclassified Aureimonas]